jgi:type IV pilus assembly protein PilN
MRLDINLASQPYEDARQFWMRWGTGLAVLSIITLALVATTISNGLAARRDHADMTDLKAKIAQRDRTRQQAEDFLNRPQNRSTRDQSQYLNELIERKALSWTRVLEDMEKVMPGRVHLVAIQPKIDEDNQLALSLQVAGDSRDRAIELAKRMEDSRRFAQTYIEGETSQAPSARGDNIQVTIHAIYIPETIPVPEPAVKAAGTGTKAEVPKTSEAPKTETPKDRSKDTSPDAAANRNAPQRSQH